MNLKSNHSATRILMVLMIGLLVAFFYSCKKIPETIGNELQPDDNFISLHRTDSVNIVSYSVLADSLGTKTLLNALLGSMKDPVFGVTNAGFYTQLHLSSTSQHFGSNPVLDSVVLQLCYSGYYGDTSALQTVHVYELSDTLSAKGTYYASSTVATYGEDYAGGYQFHPHPKTSGILLATDTVKRPVIRIPLSSNLGEKLIHADSAVFSAPDKFKEFFKGLYVTCESVSEGGAISYINMTNNTYTKLLLYYRESPESPNPRRYDFYVTSADTYFNHYEHDYSLGSEAFVQQFVNGDTASGRQTLYLQSMGGVKTFLKFPDIARLGADSLKPYQHVVVNQAKLILPASSLAEDTANFRAPNSLVLVGINDNGSTYLLPDYFEGGNYFGGNYSKKTKDVTFHITKYVQSIISGKRNNNGIYLSINGASFNAQRWIIAGPQSQEERKLRLEIIYSIVGE